MATVQPAPGFAKAAATHPAPLGGSFFCSSWGAPLIKKENANALYASIHALAFSFFMAELFVGNFSQWLTDGEEGAIIY